MNAHRDKIDELNQLAWEQRFDKSRQKENLARLKEARKLSEQIEYPGGMACADLYLAIILFHAGRQKEAHQLLLSVLPYFEEHDEETGYSTVLRYFANLYYGFGNLTLGIEYATKALRVAEKQGFTEGIGEACNDLGQIYQAEGDHQQALDYLKQARKIKEQEDDRPGMASAINRIARTYADQGMYEEAIRHYRKSEEIRKKHGPASLPWTYIGIAGTYEKMGKHQQAIDYYLKIREEHSGHIDPRILCYLNLGLGRAYMETGNTPGAHACFNEAAELAEKIEAKNLMIEAHKSLATIYEQQEDLDQSLKHHHLFISMLEEFYSAENRTRLKNLQISYAIESEQKEKEIYRLRNVELKEALTKIGKQKNQIEKQRNELADALAELKRTQNQLLETRKMEALSGMVAGLAHQINTPLGIGVTAVSSLMEQTKTMAGLFQENKVSRTGFKEYINETIEAASLLQKNLDRAAALVQMFKQVSVDQTGAQKQQFYLRSFVRDVAASMIARSGKTGIELELNCDEKLGIKASPGDVARIVSNLVGNSLVHAFSGRGKITIDIRKAKDMMLIQYSDNGRGIPADLLPRIFDPFVTSDQQKGAGLGLHIVYNLVTQKLKGIISCRSLPESGTKFYINIPLNPAE